MHTPSVIRGTPKLCSTQPHKGHFTSKLKYRRFLSYLLLLPSHLSPSPVHPTGFSLCFFPCFFAIFTLLSSNSNVNDTLKRARKIMNHFISDFSS